MGERHDEGTHRIRDRKANVSEKRVIEVIDTLGAIRVASRGHFTQHERVATHRALAKDNEVPGEKVGAFDGDRNRHDLVAAGEIVLRAETDALAAVYVHRVIRDLPGHLGNVVLQHRRRHGRLLAAIDRSGCNRARGIHGVREPDHARDHGFDALELTNGRVELTPDARVRTRRPGAGLGATSAVRRQRDAATD